MNKLISSSREKRIFILSCLTLLLFIFYRGVYIPLTQTNEILKDKVLVLEKQLTKNQYAIAKNQQFQSDYDEAINCFKNTAPEKEQISIISNELQKIAQNLDLEIKTSQAVKFKSSSTSNIYSISASINGKPKAILEFLNTLQSCPYLFNISLATLEKRSSLDSKIQCQLLLSKTYIK